MASRRKIEMVAPGNMLGVFRPTRVSSSTSPSRLAIDGTEVSSADVLANGLPSALTGAERHVIALADSGAISWSEAYDTIEQMP